MRSARPGRRRVVVMVLFIALLPTATIATARSGGDAERSARSTQTLADALAREVTPGEIRPASIAPRRRTPEDRYAMAGGCYVLRSVATRKYLMGEDFVLAQAPLSAAQRYYFQPIDLGKYLVVTPAGGFVSQPRDVTHDGTRPVTDVGQGYAAGTGEKELEAVRGPVIGAVDAAEEAADNATESPTAVRRVVVASTPSGSSEWVVRAAPGGGFTFHLAVDDHEPDNPGPLDPEIAATLSVTAGPEVGLIPGVDSSPASRFTFELAKGCFAWPEIETNVTGPHYVGDSPYAETKGYFDGHLHLMGFEFLGGKVICGRPWHPYGVAHALVDCPDHAAGGYSAIAEQALSGRPQGHDTTGWPKFTDWPRYDSFTHQQVYYKWLERSWRGGLRMLTTLLVENTTLCKVYPLKKNRCNEMDSARLQAQRLRELERYIDAQYGGPGEGWFRIVTDPFQARRVINAGKLAVVMGLEVSLPFDCRERMGAPQCTVQDIEAGLVEVYAMGVRQMELLNKFDNALGGVTGDDGQFGLLANNGNRLETGHTWKMGPCEEPEKHDDHDHRHDKTQVNAADSGAPVGRDAIFGAVLHASGQSGVSQVYGPGPHCNVIGLSDLGRGAIDGLIKRGMIFDPDHMSARARKESIEHLALRRYSGVISSHSWGDNPTYRAILRLGGVVTPTDAGSETAPTSVPGPGSDNSFVRDWRLLRGYADPRFVFGLGFGSDINGFSRQAAPRNPDESNDVDYPFRALGGAVVHQQRSGEQVYDVNTDGVDHYGLYPDWVEDNRVAAGRDGAALLTDVQRATEAYLQMWERAIGIRGDACRPDVRDLTRGQIRRVQVGMRVEEVLVALGQPKSRARGRLTFCGESGIVSVRLGTDGRVRSISSSRR